MARTQFAAEGAALPPGFSIYSPYPFAGLNQQSSRDSIDDREFFWLENLIRIGPGTLRSLWDIGPAIYTTTTHRIVSFFFYNIAQNDYVVLFFDNGTAVQIDTNSMAQVSLSSTQGTFFVPGGGLPACSQFGSQYLLISNNNTRNDYWVWDGSILYSSGSLGPVVTLTDGGTGYSSVPTVTLVGGSGSGAVLRATVANGSVVAVNVINPGTGYQPGDVPQVFFSGGGSDTSAQLVAVLSGGTVRGADVSNGGSGYTSAPNVVFSPPTSGTTATGTAIVVNGVVTSIAITNAGSNYTATPTITITGGGGANATAVAILSAGSVSAVTVVNGGSGFAQAPTLTIAGGGGTGATATAVMSGDSISSVTVTNGGHSYTSTPAVEVQPGINAAAAATVELMPFGVSGSALETFQQRVWLEFPHQEGTVTNSGVMLTSAPESLTDFAPTDGGNLFVNSDRFLRKQFTAIRQSGSYLYPFGDSSVNVISNVQTSGNPLTTTFNYQNVDPQVGTPWRDAMQDFGNDIIFANPLGVYAVYGGSVRKISDKLDKLFTTAIFPPKGTGITPSSAVASIYNNKTYLLNMTISDPILNKQRTVMLAYDERDWFVVSQSRPFTYIGTQEVSSQLVAWGTDGSSLWPLLQQPSDLINKTISTKTYGLNNLFVTKQSLSFYMQIKDLAGTGVGFLGTIDTDGGNFPMDVGPQFPGFGPSPGIFAARTGDIYGQELGWTLLSISGDFEIQNMQLGYVDYSPLF